MAIASPKGACMQDITRRSFISLVGMGALSSMGAALCAGMSGCSPSGETSSNAHGGSSKDAKMANQATSQVIVTMTPSSEPAAGFNPLFSWGCGEHVHEPLIQSTLFTTDAELNFVNDLATSYDCSEDGLTWTFRIRDDVRFTDGEPLTASDVAFTILGIRDNEAAEADLSMVADAVATDSTTCVVTLNKPFNAILYTLAVVGIVPEHAYSDDYGRNPIGSGRYMLEQWDVGQQVILRANPDYYGPQPSIERLVVLFMEEDASLAAAMSGQADVAYTAATLAGSAKVADYELFICKSVDSRGISLPCISPGGTKKDGISTYPTGNEVTSDLSLRRAINHGVDRDTMVKNVLEGYGTAAYSVSDGMPWSSSAMEVRFDRDLSQKLMEDDGWQLGDDGIFAKDGIIASFELYYSASDSVRQALANEFANQMADIGIEVIPKGASWDEIYEHEYDTPVLWGWGANSPIEAYSLHYSTSPGNYAVYDNSSVDAHLDAALAATTVEESYPEWQAAAWDGSQGFAPEGGAPWVWLVNVDHLYFKRDGLVVAQQKPHPHGHGWSLVNNVDQWHWE